MSILRGPHVACPPFFISLFYSAHTHFLSIVRGPHVACPPFFFSLSGFVSLLAVSLAENPFVVFFFVGRNYSASTRSTWISSRGLVSPTIQPPIVIYAFIVCLLAVITPRPPVPRGFHPAV